MPQQPSWHNSRWHKNHPEARTPFQGVPGSQKEKTATINKSTAQRLLEFVEHPLFTTSVGTLGGIVGVILYPWVLAVCGLCIVLAFHRANVVVGRHLWKVQLPTYVLLFIIVGAGLFWLRQKLTVSRANVYVDRIAVDPQNVNEISVECLNDSDVPATDMICIAEQFLVGLATGHLTESTEEEKWAEFTKYLMSQSSAREPRILEPHHRASAGFDLADLTESERKSVWERHETTLLFTGMITWSDAGGGHKKEFCRWIEAPDKPPKCGDLVKYRLCHHHNNQLY